MAIQIDLTTSQYGVPFTAAYFRIATAAITHQRSGGPSKFSVMIDVAGYGTPEPGDDTRDIEFRRYHTDLAQIEAQPGSAFLDKCYAWVMAQPDMAGSTGV